jgi:Flp pilus assembly protein TadG
MNRPSFRSEQQCGAVAIIAAVALPILIGFAGLALDLGHMYIEKAELQNATDACALAASRELTCDPAAGACATSYLLNAENSGLSVASRNRVDFQTGTINGTQISANDIKFSTTLAPNSNYLSRADGANPASKYVMCTARQTGIIPWFMQVLGIGNQTVSAQAVATLAPAQTNCAIPIGVCQKDPTSTDPFAGLSVGQWLTSKLSESATGSFGWADFTPNAPTPGVGGGSSELAELLKGTGACSLPPPPSPVGAQGDKTALGKAWNTRFGLYKASTNIISSPPDYTGTSYTPTSWPSKFNAYAGTGPIPNYQSTRAQHLEYRGDVATYPAYADGLNVSNGGVTRATLSQHGTLGADRRLVTVPIVNCTSWQGTNPQTVSIKSYACILMLHPMDNDNGPSSPTDEVWVEYRGKSTDPDSPCATSGAVGGPGSIGPLVPSLVQ